MNNRGAIKAASDRRRTWQPDDPGTTDGCTLFPDGDWFDCCAAHDEFYRRGGTPDERRMADRILRNCVKAGGRPLVAALMYAGVRVCGAEWLPFGWRWGKGGGVGWDWSWWKAKLNRD